MSGAYEYWYVPADSPMKTFKDAAGKSVAFSTRGSSTNLMVLGLAKLNGVTLNPVATGGPVSTLTQTMSKQVDVGWGFPPIGVDQLNKGQIRVIGRGRDVPEFAHQTLRFLVANKQSLESKRDALVRYMQAYRETLDWMYSDPEAVKAYATYAKVSEEVARRTRDEFVPKENANPDRISGLDDAMKNAVELKFVPAPLSAQQIKELVQVPFR
jgi:NitT/TauT family transport system substrate-binding protein